MRIAFLGLGLIGGSVARAVRAHGLAGAPAELVAWTRDGSGPRAALDDGVINEAAPDAAAAVDGARLVVLAAPPLACVELLRRLGRDGDLHHSLGANATVTDVASTKAALLATAADGGVPYVGGHPMAGREASGFDASDGTLFSGRPWVLTEAVHGGDAGMVRELARACGARPMDLDAATHDRLVAAISHLPLVASVALVEAVAGTEDWPGAQALAASGWRDTTRLARGDVTMGAEIAASNAVAIAARMRDLRARLDEWIELLEAPGGPDVAAVRDRLATARQRLDG
jgi:prephenate dehydrogenase